MYKTLSVLLTAWFCATAALPRPTISASPATDLLRSEILSAQEDGVEFRVAIAARSAGSSWDADGRECAVLEVFIDGRYDQHVFLAGGEQTLLYEFIVGPLARGEHALRIEHNRTWTPDLPHSPEILEFRATALNRSEPSEEAAWRAPILYLRGDTARRLSDMPLLMYWEREKLPAGYRLVYTVIFSNEDGGTNTERLMARWGRTADIEWCYSLETKSSRIVETYQAKDHKVLPFRGRYEGSHPMLYDATHNNNFSDVLPEGAAIRVRPYPVPGDLNDGSREVVMDRYPWTYAVTALEMKREGKIEDPGDPESIQVSDLRNYAVLELCAMQRGTELRFEVKIAGKARWFSSDHLDPKSRIDRGGCFRSTVELPPGTRPEHLRTLRIQCLPAPVPEGERPPSQPGAVLQRINRLFLLDDDFRPGRNLLATPIGRTLKPGASLSLEIPHSN
jgi:hypothetical protein